MNKLIKYLEALKKCDNEIDNLNKIINKKISKLKEVQQHEKTI